ncbi:hypothetical protein ACIBTV_27665 [Micromonospora sp. NPDC049366]|uniref:hypothetical protein n=1 Tax=Micromonospora sp. NPDC049366 TaxID=3364271 RepID=UPI0037B5179C
MTAVVQGAAVVAVAGWSGWWAYQAQTGAEGVPPLLAAGGAGIAAALAVLTALVFARAAGAQDARQVIADQDAERARERRVGRHRAALAGQPVAAAVGEWAAVNSGAGGVPARRVLENAAAHRFALPAGLRGAKASAARMLAEQGGDVVAVADRPASVEPAVGPEDARWLPAVRRLAAAMAVAWQPGDGSPTGRGVIDLADRMEPLVPELDDETVVDFVGDFVVMRAGHRPTSGRDWHGALDQHGDVAG